MFTIKIFVTLLLIQSLQLTFAQQDDDLGSIESLPRFEARRQSALNDNNNKEDFEYDDDDGSSRGPVNPLPARTGRNDDSNEDDFDENQAPQREDNGSPAANVGSNSGPGSVKGQVSPSSSGRLGLPRFPGQQINSFVAPLPVQPVQPVVVAPVRPTVVPVSISSPSTPITVVGKTNLGAGSQSPISFPRFIRPNDPTKSVRVVTRVVRPGPIAVDQSASLPSGLDGQTKSAQVNPTVTRVIRPVLVSRQPAFVPTPVFQPVLQPVAPGPVSIATPITSGSNGPNVIVSGGVKSVPVLANSKVQPPRLRVVTTRRPTTPIAPEDNDEDASADSRPAPGQISGVKTIASANPVPLVPLSQFGPGRPFVQPARQPSRLEVIYADEKLNTQDEDEDEEDANAAGLSQSNIVKFNRPLAPIPVRAVPQPYLAPIGLQGPRPLQPTPNGVFFQHSARPTLVPSGKTNGFRSNFNVRPQPVPVAPTLVPVAPVQPNPAPVLINSGSGFGSQPTAQSQSQLRRPQISDSLASDVSGVKGSGVASGSRPSVVRPVLVRTPAPTTRPLVQIREEPLPTFQQIDLIRTQPAARPLTTFQGQAKALPTVSGQVVSRPTVQPIVQLRDGASGVELPLPSPPRPIQIVRVTPAPTSRPITQINQDRESALPSVQPVQISQPRLVPVSPVSQQQVVQISEPARPFPQVRDSGLPFFQPLDPALRPAIPSIQFTNQAQESVAPRETFPRQPVRPVQVIQPQQQQFVQENRVQQPSIADTVQLKESAIPITSSQSNLGGQRPSRPQPVQNVFTSSQEQAPAPAPQSFEILRLREPSLPQFPLAPRQPQPLVQVRPRLVPAALPVQSVQSNLPVARPSLVQVSQQREPITLNQPLAPTPVLIQPQAPQQQQRIVSFPSIQQVQANAVPVAPVTNGQFIQPLVRQTGPSFPRLIAPLPLPQPGRESQSLGQPITVQNRVSQPNVLVQQQQQRPTIVLSQPQPSPLIVQRQRPVAPVVPVAPLSVQSGLSQSDQQQLVQIREKVSSAPDQFSQIEQVRLARA